MSSIEKWGRRAAWVVIAAMSIGTPMAVAAQSEALASSVEIPSGVTANGQPLPAGTYTLRVSSDPVTSVVGQGPEAARWVEFVQDGQVRGRELASVVAPPDVEAVAKRTPPAEGRGLVQVLRGNEYLRVWVNDGGTQYLVHLMRSAAN